MSTAYPTPEQAMPTLTKIALRTTVVTCLLFVAAFPVMLAQETIGILFALVAFVGWLIASFCGLFGAAQAKLKAKAINVLLFSIVGPLLSILLMMLIFVFLR